MNKHELIAEYKQRLEEAEIRHNEILPNMHISKAELQERMCNYRLFITDLESLDVFDQWNYTKHKTPLAYQSGHWDGKKSDEVIAEDADGVKYLAHVYEGTIDGSEFLDWYEVDGCMIENVVRWLPIPL